MKEAEDIQKIGLPRCVRPDQKHTTLKVYVDLGEVTPIFQVDMRESQRHDTLLGTAQRLKLLQGGDSR